TQARRLERLLDHCREHVPYYAALIKQHGDGYKQDPFAYLREFPILTKTELQTRHDELCSDDLASRRWYYNTSGGSTGVPARFIQDATYAAETGAAKHLFSLFAGREVCEPEVYIWGSERDIQRGGESLPVRAMNWLTDSTFFNAYRMSPQAMRAFVERINRKPPRLIIGYVEALFGLSSFILREKIQVRPQHAVMSSAGTLFPFMRERIERAFGCRVFDRYGSREVGDVACERADQSGLWCAPWTNYLEVVDRQGQTLPPGACGNFLITSLCNFAMPLLRYQIGDAGALSPASSGQPWQVIQTISGRLTEMFMLQDGTLVDIGYFSTLLYFKDWIERYQIVQKSYTEIVYRIVAKDPADHSSEMKHVVEEARRLLGPDGVVGFEIVDDIPLLPSGKFAFAISEVNALPELTAAVRGLPVEQ
ncbi:MAG: phenylacetate--CoA ligase family protein, partial [Anaerolineae bacterium]|nr:phenylacetate--CoA ligase family protein [Anaerolineae bacterium]